MGVVGGEIFDPTIGSETQNEVIEYRPGPLNIWVKVGKIKIREHLMQLSPLITHCFPVYQTVQINLLHLATCVLLLTEPQIVTTPLTFAVLAIVHKRSLSHVFRTQSL